MLYLGKREYFSDAMHYVVECFILAVNNPKKSGPMLNEAFLGLLYPTDNYRVWVHVKRSFFFLFLISLNPQNSTGLWFLLIVLCYETCSYGYLTNTKVKLILVTTDLDVRDADVRNVSMIKIWCLPFLF